MNLAELKHTVDFTTTTLRAYEKPEDIDVVIHLQEPSIGGIACAGVTSGHRGIDWDTSRFILAPSARLRHEGKTKDDVVAPWVNEYDYGTGRKTVIRDCRMCSHRVNADHRYCPHCGQRLR